MQWIGVVLLDGPTAFGLLALHPQKSDMDLILAILKGGNKISCQGGFGTRKEATEWAIKEMERYSK